MSTNNKNTSVAKSGFTLVEMLIVAPIVILLIGGFISAIVSMTGAVIASRASSGLAVNVQDALNRIDLDVKASTSLLAYTFSPLTSPQGYNNDTTYFTNIGANGTMLIIGTNATTGNPLNSTSNTVYWNTPNPCSSSANSNAPVVVNIVYFVKNNSLWRRTIMPSGYSVSSCVNGAPGQPWQRPSCDPTINDPACKAQDEKLLTWTKSGSFAVDYFTSTDTVTPIPGAVTGNDAARLAAIQTASSVKATITATSTVAGRDVSQSGTIRATSLDKYTTSQATLAPGSQTFDYTGTIVNFTVPTGATSINITAKGAQGGQYTSTTGGLGASLTGTFAVTGGQILSILVGQWPPTTSSFPAGGGGTFVGLNVGADYTTATPMIAAGGGGATYSGGTGQAGQITVNGGGGTVPGLNGYGALSTSCAGGGGGFYSSGGNDTYYPATGKGGVGFRQGGVSIASTSGYQTGGFGGGSSADYVGTCNTKAGSGGGYSGGSAQSTTGLIYAGYGGGSFNGGTNQTNTAGVQTGNGQVIISWGS